MLSLTSDCGLRAKNHSIMTTVCVLGGCVFVCLWSAWYQTRQAIAFTMLHGHACWSTDEACLKIGRFILHGCWLTSQHQDVACFFVHGMCIHAMDECVCTLVCSSFSMSLCECYYNRQTSCMYILQPIPHALHHQWGPDVKFQLDKCHVQRSDAIPKVFHDRQHICTTMLVRSLCLHTLQLFHRRQSDRKSN